MWILAGLLLQQPDLETALKEFRKNYRGSEADKLAALDGLKGIVDEKVLAELTRAIGDTPAIRARAVGLIAAIDHPRSAEMLAGMVRANLADPVVMGALCDAVVQLRWDSFIAAIAGPMLVDKIYDKDKQMAKHSATLALRAELVGSLAFVEPLIQVTLKLEKTMAGVKDLKKWPNFEAYRNNALRALKACTGEDKADGASYDAWWRANKSQAQARARQVMWCKATGKRWDKRPDDGGAYCPHHDDKAAAKADGSIVAMRSLK
jgi:hypothetical protein